MAVVGFLLLSSFFFLFEKKVYTGYIRKKVYLGCSTRDYFFASHLF